VKMALKRSAASGKLLHTKRIGASGSFRVPKEEKKEKKPKNKPASETKKVKEARRQEGSAETCGKKGCKKTGSKKGGSQETCS